MELINEARTDPASAAERIDMGLSDSMRATLDRWDEDLDGALRSIASAPERPPVAWRAELAEASQNHSDDLARRNVQSHFGPNGETLSDRIRITGMPAPRDASENVITKTRSTEEAMQAFLVDWKNPENGHRKTIQKSNFNEAGVAVVPVEVERANPFLGPSAEVPTETRYVVTQVFAQSSDSSPQLLGVIYNDTDGDDFYSVGEGIGSARIRVTNLATGARATIEAWDTGGYQTPLSPGRYRVEALDGGRVIGSQDVTIGEENVKVDFRAGETLSAPRPAPLTTTSLRAFRSTPDPAPELSKAEPQAAPTPTLRIVPRESSETSSAPAESSGASREELVAELEAIALERYFRTNTEPVETVPVVQETPEAAETQTGGGWFSRIRQIPVRFWKSA